MLRGTLAIALVALTASACSVSRSASVKAEVRGLTAEVRDSLRVEQLMVAVHDTIVETTTITIRENEQGDTVRMSVVRDRDRVRSMSDVRSKKEEVRVVRDTVYVEKRDSLLVKSEELRVKSSLSHHTSAISHLLKWVFWIIVGLSALIIIVKLKVIGDLDYGKD